MTVKIVLRDRVVSISEVGEVKPVIFGVVASCIDSEGWTQKYAAEVLEIDQPKISNIKNGKILSFSLERLFRFLFLTGYKVVLRCDFEGHVDDIPLFLDQDNKLRVMSKVAYSIHQRKWTQKYAALVLKLDQPKISHIKNLKPQGFSLERLMGFLISLGYNLDIVIEKK